MLAIRERMVARSILVHAACVHPTSRFDRFGDEVCCECGHALAIGVATPNEGLESCRPSR